LFSRRVRALGSTQALHLSSLVRVASLATNLEDFVVEGVARSGVGFARPLVEQVLLVDLHFEEVLGIRVLNIALLQQLLLTNLSQALSLVKLLDRALEALQAQDQDRDVVEGATARHLTQAHLHALSRSDVLIVVELLVVALLVEVTAGRGDLVRLAACGLLTDAVPHHINDLLVVDALKDTVASNQEEVKVVLELETDDLRLAHDHVGVAAVTGPLGLNVSKGF
jgi:hypothetical protein